MSNLGSNKVTVFRLNTTDDRDITISVDMPSDQCTCSAGHRIVFGPGAAVSDAGNST